MIENRKLRGIPEVVRDEMVFRDRIIELLQQGPRSIPQVAEILGHPTWEVMIWVMAMRRFGTVEETGRPDAEGYYQYKLKK
jgi:hypothetical protein